MAVIGEIRKRGVLVLIVVGLALVAFVLTDAMSSIFGGGQGQGQPFVDGEPLTEQDYERKQLTENLTAYNMRFNPQTQKYDKPLNPTDLRRASLESKKGFVTDMLAKKQAEVIGIEVPDKFLEIKMIKGDDSEFDQTPYLPFIFGDESKRRGFKDINDMKKFGKKILADDKYYQFTKETYAINFYRGLFFSGIYAPQAAAKHAAKKQDIAKHVRYVYVPHATVNEVEPTEDELKAYYDKNKHDPQFRNDAPSRTIEWIKLGAEVNKEDQQYWERLVNNRKKTFENAINDSAYVVSVKNRNPNRWQREAVWMDGKYGPEIDSLYKSSKVGEVVGPFQNGKDFVMIKKREVEINPAPDVRHILFSFTNEDNAKIEDSTAKAAADSLWKIQQMANAKRVMAMLKADSSKFAELAEEYNEDPGQASNGGYYRDVDSASPYVQPFKDFALNAELGEVDIVETQFGYHLMQRVPDPSKKISYSEVRYEIRPRQENLSNVRQEAEELVQVLMDSSLSAYGKREGLQNNEVTFKMTDLSVPGMTQFTAMNGWAFDRTNQTGEISDPIFNDMEDAFYIAKLVKKHKVGPKSYETVKEQVRARVIAQKKAEAIKAKVGSFTSLNDVAQKTSAPIKEDTDVTFNKSSLQNNNAADVEVIAAIHADFNDGDIIPFAIEGSQGVYYVQIIKTTDKAATDPNTLLPGIQNKFTGYISGFGTGDSPFLKMLKKKYKVNMAAIY